MKDLIPYDDNSMLDLLSDTSNVNSFAKAVGDFTRSAQGTVPCVD